MLWLTWTQVVDGSWLQMFMSALFFATGAHPYGPIPTAAPIAVRSVLASQPPGSQAASKAGKPVCPGPTESNLADSVICLRQRVFDRDLPAKAFCNQSRG